MQDGSTDSNKMYQTAVIFILLNYKGQLPRTVRILK